MRESRLRIKERYDNNMIRSFSYRGQQITVAELALINPNFPNQSLSKLEETLSKSVKTFKLRNSETLDEQRRKKAAIGIQRMLSSRKPYIASIKADARIQEAHWHGKQAAFAMEQSINQ